MYPTKFVSISRQLYTKIYMFLAYKSEFIELKEVIYLLFSKHHLINLTVFVSVKQNQ